MNKTIAMKRIVFPIVFVLATLGFAHTACATEPGMLQTDTSGYHKFRADAEKKIKENEQKIAELKAKKKEGTQDVVEKYNKRVAELEEKNKDLRKRMNNYNASDKNQKWDAFKREFNRDMNELGQSLRDLAKDNVK